MKNKIIKNKFIQLWLIIGLITCFITILFFIIAYLNENILCDVDCRAQNEVSLVLILVSLVGMFVGSLTYYFISEKYENKINKIQKDISLTLKFLDKDDKLIVSTLLKNSGKITQSNLVKETKLSRVKIFRNLKKLEEKNIITKKPKGMTNLIELDKELRKVLLD